MLFHYYVREAKPEICEDIGTVLEPGLVASIEPMLAVPEGTFGVGA